MEKKGFFSVSGLGFNGFLLILLVLVLGVYLGRTWYFQPKYAQGEKAPVFSGIGLDGKAISLSDFEGSYVLLDFWGSWCPPCRAQNVEWVQFYEEYTRNPSIEAVTPPLNTRNRIQLVSIGLERNADAWKKAIVADGLAWPHHILEKTESLKFFTGPNAKAYGITQVPTNYLIDPKGNIVGVNVTPAMVNTILNQ